MAEEAEEIAQEGEEETTKSSKKKLMLPLAAVGSLLIVGAIVYFLGIFDSTPEAISQEVENRAQALPEVVYFTMEELTVNLSGKDDRIIYIKITPVLETASEETFMAIEKQMPRILDSFYTYLRGLRLADLEGSDGLFRLKEALLRRINLILHPQEILAIRFKRILIQ